MSGPKLLAIRAVIRKRRVQRLVHRLEAQERAVIQTMGQLLALAKPGGRLEAELLAALRRIN